MEHKEGQPIEDKKFAEGKYFPQASFKTTEGKDHTVVFPSIYIFESDTVEAVMKKIRSWVGMMGLHNFKPLYDPVSRLAEVTISMKDTDDNETPLFTCNINTSGQTVQ